MQTATRFLCAAALGIGLSLTLHDRAQAQYPVVYQPAVPAVVGYTAERRGLFGRRLVYRPIVAPVAAAAPVVTAARPVVTAARPVVRVARPVVSVARPVLTAPVTVQYPPAVAPVTTYYPPPVVVGF